MFRLAIGCRMKRNTRRKGFRKITWGGSPQGVMNIKDVLMEC